MTAAPPIDHTSQPQSGHQPVLLAEAIAWLAPRAGGRYLDGTFGGGGHTSAILAASAPDGVVLALDADPAATARAAALAATLEDPRRLRPEQTNFANLAAVARAADLAPLDGILLDLGLSSFQLDEAARGFSFQGDGPLDMRFDPTAGTSAADLVNDLPERELADLIWTFGEEPKSRRIARALVQERERQRITTTGQLAAIVERASGGRRGRATHPATKTFQALRIATNAELDVLERALSGAVEVLNPGGRLVVIAFHSLEDRIVKRFIERETATCVCPPRQPICTCDQRPRLERLTRKAVRPSLEEVAANPRSRSAVLRAAMRLPDPEPSPIPGERP
jgi:16S rRNA (cytosine1402-N4)-methyltransferase